MTETNFRDKLIQRTRIFSLDVMNFVDGVSRQDYSMRIIGHQVIRSATSIGANITEAQASPSKKDFTNFLHHALKSANETKYWISLLLDSGKTNKEKAFFLLKEATEISNILGASIVTLKSKK